MKRSVCHFLFIIVCLLLISSCSKETVDLGDASKSIMSAKVDGALVECTIIAAQVYDLTSKKSIQIMGSKGNEGFQLTIDDFKGIGTYDLATANIGVYLGDSQNAQNTNYLSESGNVKITSISEKEIRGTFEFKGRNLSNNQEKTISEGKFSISLVVPKAPVVNPADKNFTAKIDGTSIAFSGQANLIKSSMLGNVMSIIGLNGDKILTIGFFDYKGVGTYNLGSGPTNVTISFHENQLPTGEFQGSSGKVVITSSTSTAIKGTFECVTSNPSSTSNKRTITEGQFELNYATQTMP